MFTAYRHAGVYPLAQPSFKGNGFFKTVFAQFTGYRSRFTPMFANDDNRFVFGQCAHFGVDVGNRDVFRLGDAAPFEFFVAAYVDEHTVALVCQLNGLRHADCARTCAFHNRRPQKHGPGYKGYYYNIKVAVAKKKVHDTVQFDSSKKLR
jgi:hypothetical protein